MRTEPEVEAEGGPGPCGPAGLLALACRRSRWVALALTVCLVLAALPATAAVRFAAVLVAVLCVGILGTTVHECGHAVALWLLHGQQHRVRVRFAGPVALAMRPEVFVEDRRIAAAGPLAAGLAGGLVLAVGVLGHSGAVVALALPLLVHLGGLLPGNGDGDLVWGVAG